jgi:NADPH-dependent F420 reductase
VPRTIAIVGGTGPEGMGLALRWVRAGERIIIGSRDEQRARDAAAKITKASGAPAERVTGAANAAAVAAADVVVLTIPFSGHADTLKQLKPSFRPGAILIDATVPLAPAVGGKPTRTLGVWQGSAAEQAAELVPEGVQVAAAFHNVSASELSSDEDVDCDVIVCSDHPAATQAAIALAALIPGVRGVDGGRLENARTVEQLTALLIAINLRNKTKHAGIRITGMNK